jgi:hypothetical protein
MLRCLLLAALLIGLPAGAIASGPQSDTRERADDPPDKRICKRFLETGSLVRGYRVCKTKSEWERERDNLRQGGTAAASCRSMGQTGSC